jgi:hypothetical protein
MCNGATRTPGRLRCTGRPAPAACRAPAAFWMPALALTRGTPTAAVHCTWCVTAAVSGENSHHATLCPPPPHRFCSPQIRMSAEADAAGAVAMHALLLCAEPWSRRRPVAVACYADVWDCVMDDGVGVAVDGVDLGASVGDGVDVGASVGDERPAAAPAGEPAAPPPQPPDGGAALAPPPVAPPARCVVQ